MPDPKTVADANLMVEAQITASRLRRENRQLRRTNAMLLAGFALGAAAVALAGWLAPVGWFPL